MELRSKAFVIGSVLFVAACGSSAIGVADIESLGEAFVAMFNQEPNSEPVDAQSVPLTVSYTTDPFNP